MNRSPGQSNDSRVPAYLSALVIVLLVAVASPSLAIDPPAGVVPIQLPISGNDDLSGTPQVIRKTAAPNAWEVLENFNCPDASCLWASPSDVQRETYTGDCNSSARTFLSREVSTGWYDGANYPLAVDSVLNGLGSQRVGFDLQGSYTAPCDSIVEYARVFKTFAPGVLTAAQISAKYMVWPAFIVLKEATDTVRVLLQVNYSDGGSPSSRLSFHRTPTLRSWNEISVADPANREISSIILAVGGPFTSEGNLYVDDIMTYKESCNLSVSSIDFDDVFVGHSSNESFTITNTSETEALTLNVNLDCAHYSIIAGGGSAPLAPGASRLVTIRYAPTTEGLHLCTVQTGSEFCGSVALTGNAVPPPPPSCSLSTASIDYGEVGVGESLDRSFTLFNTSNEVSLPLDVKLNCADYSIVSGGGLHTLDEGDSLKVTIRYAPTSHGLHPCTVETGSSACETMTLTGDTKPICEIDNFVRDFGSVEIGKTKDLQFKIKNVGGSLLQGTVPATCGPFTVTNFNRDFSFPNGGENTYTVRYAPTAECADSCALFVSEYCEEIVLKGTGFGLPICTIEPLSLDFGRTPVGEDSVRTVTITNSGFGTVAGTFGGGCGDYTVLETARDYSLKAGESAVFSIRYAPVEEEGDTCSIATGSSLCDSLSVYGYGFVAPVCSISTAELLFGTVVQGDTSYVGFRVENVGGDTLRGTVQAGCTGFYILEPEPLFSLAAGESDSFTVCFAPDTAGNYSCEIQTATECALILAEGLALTDTLCNILPSYHFDFGEVAVGSTKDTLFTIRNDGGRTLSGTLDRSCGPFSIAGDLSYSLAPGESKEFSLTYAPTLEATTICRIFTGLPCDSLDLIGVGVLAPICTVSPPALDFGLVSIGASADLIVTIGNDGLAPLEGELNDGCGPFTVVDIDRSFILNSGETKNFTIRFAPSDLIAYSCTLSTGLLCDDLYLSGTGDDPPLCAVAPLAIDYGAVAVGSSAAQTITISNDGGGLLEGEIDTGCGPFVVTDIDRAYSLARGEQKTFTVQFAPVEATAFTCTLSTGLACAPVSLSGTGEQLCNLALLFPAGGELIVSGATVSIEWDPSVCEGDVRIDLLRGESPCATLSEGAPNTGSFEWLVGLCDTPGEDYAIRISLVGGEPSEDTSGPFAITAAPELELPITSIEAEVDPLIAPTLTHEIIITNNGAVTLTWSAQATEPWIELQRVEGAVPPGESDTVAVALNPAELPAGEHLGGIALTTNDPDRPNELLGVSLSVIEYQKGDVTVNGRLDVVDLGSLISHVLEVTLLDPAIVNLGLADTNDDLLVDVSDVVRLARMVLEGFVPTDDVARGTTSASLAQAITIREAGAGATVEISLNGLGDVRAGVLQVQWSESPAPEDLRVNATCSDFALISETAGDVTTLLFYSVEGADRPIAKNVGANRVACLTWNESSNNYPESAKGEVVRNGADGFTAYSIEGSTDRPGGLAQSTAVRLIAPRPNPFSSSTVLFYEVRGSGPLRLSVYDAAGRLIRTLEDRVQSPGSHTAVWDGRDGGGREVPNGVYFFRLETGAEVFTRKTIVLR